MDLELKIALGKSGLGAGPTLKAQVWVSVYAVDLNGSPVSGVLFGLSPLLYSDSKPMFFFSRPAPARKGFPPGRYVIRDLAAPTNSQIVELGLDGRDEQDVQVLIR